MSRKPVRRALFFAAVLSLSIALPGVAAGQSDVTLTVTVVDGNGNTLSGVDLSATWDDGDGGPVNESTRSNGQALIDVPSGANVTITVHDDRYVRNAPLEVTDASTRDVEVPVSLSGTATVEAVDDGGSVDRAVVRLYRDGDRVVDGRTGDDGSLTTREIERGEYEVRVWKEGYLRNATDLTVDGDVTERVEIRQDSRLLRVRVADDHFSPPRPVADANVTVGDRGTVTTLSNGETTVQVPVNTWYDVSVSKGGYETNATSVRVGESAVSRNLTIRRTPAITLEPANRRVVVGETVQVTVTDEYGDPVADATVRVEGEDAGRTDEQGATRVPVDRAGVHNLTASLDSLEAEATVEGVSAGGDETGTASPTATATSSEEPTETATPITTDEDGPGFSVLAALAGVIVGSLALRRL